MTPLLKTYIKAVVFLLLALALKVSFLIQRARFHRCKQQITNVCCDAPQA